MKAFWLVYLLGGLACDPAAARHRSVRSDGSNTVGAAPSSVAVPATAAPSVTSVDAAPYPWHADPSIPTLAATEALAARFAPPPGFARVDVPEGSFGSWLRHLPLAPRGTPVRSFSGAQHLPADHRHIAAGTPLDVGARDLQQCADAIMRLHAEWLWHQGRAKQASYPSGGGPIPWKRFLAGGYPAVKGRSFEWKSRGPREDDHSTYRKYLDTVFAWSNTVALAQKTTAIERGALRPGDFFALAGNPGHSVLLLDVAQNARGERVALLGQSFMPAQSFQVLRPERDAVWFSLEDDDGVQTPFWPRFPWSSLHRLPE
jgi:hypothetical protein